ncbi:hypothetical protein [Maribacter sp.]|uniref:hypothetical protein n=1 Tax=Maribacter sp. TaxID=1897614 RepID=UPI0032973215
MKKVFSIFLFAICIQVAQAHPSVEHHAHNSFIEQWAWFVFPVIAIAAIAWKFFNSRSKNVVK